LNKSCGDPKNAGFPDAPTAENAKRKRKQLGASDHVRYEFGRLRVVQEINVGISIGPHGYPPSRIGVRFAPHNQARCMNDADAPETTLLALAHMASLEIGYAHFGEVNWDVEAGALAKGFLGEPSNIDALLSVMPVAGGLLKASERGRARRENATTNRASKPHAD
jgi:hypothetical protein